MTGIIEKLLADPHSAQWFINFAFQSLVVLCVGWLVARLLKKKAATLRSGIILMILMVLLFLPLVSVVFQLFDMPYYRTFLPFTEGAGLDFLGSDKNGPEETAAGKERRTSSPGTALSLKGKPEKKAPGGPFFNVFTVVKLVNGIGFIWLLGFLFLFCRLVVGMFVVKRFKQGLTEIGDDVREPLEEVVKKIQKRFPGMSLPGVYMTCSIPSPVVFGIFKPVLVIPGHLYETLNENELKGILLHELSHIYHRDQLMGMLQRIVKALHWWNPAVYQLSAYFSRAREEISDNYALMENSSREYAECLINLAEKTSLISPIPLSLGMAAPHIPLKERILQILEKERSMDTKLKSSTTVLIGFIAILLTGFIIGHSWTFALEKKTKTEQKQIDPLKQRLTFLSNLANVRHYPAKMMTELENALPGDTRVTELHFSQKKLSITGETLKEDQVAKFLDNLKNRDIFQNLEYLGTSKTNNGKPLFKFKVKAIYKEGSEDIDKKIKKKDPGQAIDAQGESKEHLLNRLENRLVVEKEVATVLRKLPGIIGDSKLRILKWATLREVPASGGNGGREICYELPVMIELQGNFHNLAVFFKKVSELNKFHIIDDVTFKRVPEKLETADITLAVTFKVSLYVKRI